MNDDDSLDPALNSRLRAELDSVKPPHTTPRYLSARSRPIAWRFAPAVLVASVISMLALSASVATGSPNPADWGHDVVTIIQSSSTTPTPTPPPTVRPSPTHTPQQQATPKPAEHESPEPSDDHSGEGSGHDGGGSDNTEGHGGSSSDSGDTERS